MPEFPPVAHVAVTVTDLRAKHPLVCRTVRGGAGPRRGRADRGLSPHRLRARRRSVVRPAHTPTSRRRPASEHRTGLDHVASGAPTAPGWTPGSSAWTSWEWHMAVSSMRTTAPASRFATPTGSRWSSSRRLGEPRASSRPAGRARRMPPMHPSQGAAKRSLIRRPTGAGVRMVGTRVAARKDDRDIEALQAEQRERKTATSRSVLMISDLSEQTTCAVHEPERALPLEHPADLIYSRPRRHRRSGPEASVALNAAPSRARSRRSRPAGAGPLPSAGGPSPPAGVGRAGPEPPEAAADRLVCGLPTGDGIVMGAHVEIILVAAACATCVGVLGLGVAWSIQRRSIRWQLALVVVLGTGGALAGVLVVAPFLSISPRDRGVILLVTGIAGAVALIVALALGAFIGHWSNGLRHQVRHLDAPGFRVNARRGPGELGSLAEELARTAPGSRRTGCVRHGSSHLAANWCRWSPMTYAPLWLGCMP